MGAPPRSLALGTHAAPARFAARHALGRAAGLAAAATLVLLVLLCLGWLTGHRTFVDRSDSMRPALHAGDLVINRTAPAQEIDLRDIVTFEDPQLGRNITHRVIERRETGGRVAFVTRGDANSGVERWSAARDENVGRLVASVPHVGFALGLVTDPLVRLVLTVLCAFGLCALALRWIWSVQ